MNTVMRFFSYSLIAMLLAPSLLLAENPIVNVSMTADGSPAATVPTPPQPATQPIQPQIQQPEQPTKDDKSEAPSIYLNFENATLSSVLNYLGEQKKINIVPFKDLDNIKVSLSTRTPMTMEGAWNVMLTLLEMNNFSLVNVAGLYRIVATDKNAQEPLPTYSSAKGMEPELLPDSDLVIRYAYFFKNMKAETAQGILADKMIKGSNILINPSLNVMIIKDQSLNIKAAMKIVKELDTGGLRESIEIIPLKWANADNVKNLFKDITGSDQDSGAIRFNILSQQKEIGYFSQNTKIIAEPIKNSLIILGTQKNIDKIKTFIYKHIDLPIDDADSRLHIKELRYIQAQDIKPILDGMVQAPKGTVSEKSLVIEGGFKLFEDIIISAEQNDDGDPKKRGSGNRLIIACNSYDWKRLEDFINKLDKPQPQVALEVLIVDVSLDQTKQLGAQTLGIRGKDLFRNVSIAFNNLSSGASSASGGNPANSLIDLAGTNFEGSTPSAFFTLGRACTLDSTGKIVNPSTCDNIWSIVKSVYNFSNTNIISQPYVIANNNQECNIVIATSERVEGALEYQKNIQPIRKQDEIEAKLSLKITPFINLAGTVDLIINADISEFAASSTNEQPNRTTRNLITKTKTAVGEVLVLGGLTNSSVTETINKTPILGDLPFFSLFFKSKEKVKTERNLYVFIRPSIIKPRFEGEPDEYTQLKLDYAKYQIMKNDTYVADTDPIQRWFFKPTNQTIRQKVTDAANGILRPIDNYTYAKSRPKMVNIQDDPYYKVTEAIEQAKSERAAEKLKHAKSAKAA